MAENTFFNNPHHVKNTSLEEIQQAVMGYTEWSVNDLRQLNDIMRMLVVDTFAGHPTTDDLTELIKFVYAVSRHINKFTTEDCAMFVARWKAWVPLIDGRLAQLSNMDHERINYMPHVPDLLRAIKYGSDTSLEGLQKQMVEITSLHLKRLLRILEDHGMIYYDDGYYFLSRSRKNNDPN